MLFELGDGDIVARPLPPVPVELASAGDATALVRQEVADSVRRHLRSDVPISCLLSGGLDSSIVASVAMRELGSLHTYCSGATEQGAESDDFVVARLVAERLGTVHVEAPVTRALFARRWLEMVDATGLPLSTPNEVAINEVARRLRADGKIVTLSGEGADELFAGYEGPMRDAAAYEGLLPSARPEWTRAAGMHPGLFQLHANAWVPLESKAALLEERVWRGLEGDAALSEFYRVEFDDAQEGEALQRHLRFHRRINLAGLLQRLDTATMLAGVEGRTPFADARVCALAESLPMAEKFRDGQTKRILRRAFAADLPREVVSRPKASFPLPFERWVEDRAHILRESALAREVFTPAAIETVARQPAPLWRLAWPMINIAMWGKVWWG
jgi:asparagine synthase (glutamine-hydrolysing)